MLQALGIGFAAGSYFGAQLRLARNMRRSRTEDAAARRRRILAETLALMQRGEYARAQEVLSPLSREAPDDLLVAYRVAQVLTETGPPPAAQAAWKRLRALDRHGIYKEQLRIHETRSEH